MNQDGEVDFKEVTTFNLDEYYPMSPENPQSYRYFMDHQLFNHINIDKSRTFIPNGQTPAPEKECEDYEKKIEAYGGIDFQLLGSAKMDILALTSRTITSMWKHI